MVCVRFLRTQQRVKSQCLVHPLYVGGVLVLRASCLFGGFWVWVSLRQVRTFFCGGVFLLGFSSKVWCLPLAVGAL